MVYLFTFIILFLILLSNRAALVFLNKGENCFLGIRVAVVNIPVIGCFILVVSYTSDWSGLVVKNSDWFYTLVTCDGHC